MKLQPSELVLNKDGSIYHLNLHPHQIADTIITVGDPNRVAMVSKYFDKIEHQSSKREFITHTGWLNGHRLTVISSGIGPDNIDIVLNEMDALANVDFETRKIKEELKSLNFIRIGTSGGLQENISVDDFLISTHGLGLDNVLHYYDYIPDPHVLNILHQLKSHFKVNTSYFPSNPYLFAGSEALFKQLNAGFHKGITITSPGFYGPQGRSIRLKPQNTRMLDLFTSWNSPRFPKITNFEMETSVLYGLSKLLGHQAISCSVILANRKAKTFSKNPGKSIDLLIQKVLEKLTT